MKKIVIPLLAVVAALTFTGCTVKPGQPVSDPGFLTQEFLALARPMADTFATAMLANNPKYSGVVCGVADGLALAMQQEELTPAMVDEFTRGLRRDHPELSPIHYSAVRGFLVSLYDLWRRRFEPVIPNAQDRSRVLAELQSTLRHACEAGSPPA